jgi:hypothetical protein
MSLGLLTLIQRSAMETVQIATIAVRTEKNFRFMSIRFSAVRQYCCYSKTPTEENGHALHQHFNVHSNFSPADRGRDGVHAQVYSRGHEGGVVTVTDGPFAETKEVLGGYALLNAASKEEAVEYTRRFLDHTATETCEGTWEGTWEIYQLFEMPTGEGQ